VGKVAVLFRPETLQRMQVGFFAEPVGHRRGHGPKIQGAALFHLHPGKDEDQ
jgi:hypothetical protein